MLENLTLENVDINVTKYVDENADNTDTKEETEEDKKKKPRRIYAAPSFRFLILHQNLVNLGSIEKAFPVMMFICSYLSTISSDSNDTPALSRLSLPIWSVFGFCST